MPKERLWFFEHRAEGRRVGSFASLSGSWTVLGVGTLLSSPTLFARMLKDHSFSSRLGSRSSIFF